MKRLGVFSSSRRKNEITFRTISKCSVTFTENDWIRRSDWIPMFALKGLTGFTFSPPRGGRTCSGLSSASGTVERKGKGNKRGNRFQRECTRHVLRYMESCDCFPDSGSTRARIHGQTSLGERRGVSTRKDPSLSLIYNAKRGPAWWNFLSSMEECLYRMIKKNRITLIIFSYDSTMFLVRKGFEIVINNKKSVEDGFKGCV